jgi:hypothetical protein
MITFIAQSSKNSIKNINGKSKLQISPEIESSLKLWKHMAKELLEVKAVGLDEKST